MDELTTKSPVIRNDMFGRLDIYASYDDINEENLIAELKKRGSHALMLEVRVSNAGAIALYEKLGFYQVGCRKNYYRNPKEDALILRKEWEN